MTYFANTRHCNAFQYAVSLWRWQQWRGVNTYIVHFGIVGGATGIDLDAGPMPNLKRKIKQLRKLSRVKFTSNPNHKRPV